MRVASWDSSAFLASASALSMLPRVAASSVAPVARVDQITLLLVLLGVERGLLDHALDLVLGEAARGGDLDRLLFARAQVLRVHVHDAVGVDVEGDFDLRHAARRGRDADQVELP